MTVWLEIIKKLYDASFNFYSFNGLNKTLFLFESKSKIKTDKINLDFSLFK
jgi:hypothetical protein